jgi:tetratricopeptide (TPR) repeat protein
MREVQETLAAPENALANAQRSLNAGRFDRALAQLTPTVVRLRRRANAPLLAVCLLLQAGIHRSLGNAVAAHAAVTESYTLFTQCENMPARLQAQRTLIEVYLDLGDCVQAARQARWALSLAQDFGHDAESASLTLSLSKALLCGDWFVEGIDTLRHAIRQHSALVQSLIDFADFADFADLAGTALAHAHWRYAQALEEAGQLTASAQQRRLAKSALPATWPIGRCATHDRLMALEQSAQLKGQWGQTAAAREDVLRMLGLTRHSDSPARFRAIALTALADLHTCDGRAQLALKYHARCVSLLGTTDLASDNASAMDRLANSHAQLGQYEEALRWRRLAHRQRQEAGQRGQALRPRPVLGATMAPLHNHDNRLQDTHLLSLGRLLGHVQHAIVANTPMIRVAVGPAVRAVKVNRTDGADGTDSTVSHLERTVRSTDRTASLVHQLKMFAFRIEPQRSVVAVDRALEDAWERFLQHTPLPGWSLAFLHRDSMRISALCAEFFLDAQRFAVLLSGILAGLTAHAAQQATARVIWVDLSQESPTASRLILGVSGDEGLPDEKHWPRSICAELAQQLGLRLSFLGDNEKWRCLQLEFPQEGAS